MSNLTQEQVDFLTALNVKEATPTGKLALQLCDALLRINVLEAQLAVFDLAETKQTVLETEWYVAKMRKLVPWLLARNAKNRGRIRSWAKDLVDRIRKIEAIPQTPAKPAATPAKPKHDITKMPTMSYEEYEESGFTAYPKALDPAEGRSWAYVPVFDGEGKKTGTVETRILPPEAAYADDFA